MEDLFVDTTLLQSERLLVLNLYLILKYKIVLLGECQIVISYISMALDINLYSVRVSEGTEI